MPLLGQVAARQPIEAIESADTMLLPEDMLPAAGNSFVLRVRGDSMIDEQVRDGDIVIVEARQTAQDGEMVIAFFDDKNSVTLKKVYREPGGRVRLQPANPTMAPIIMDAKDLRIQGVVIGVMRKY